MPECRAQLRHDGSMQVLLRASEECSRILLACTSQAGHPSQRTHASSGVSLSCCSSFTGRCSRGTGDSRRFSPAPPASFRAAAGARRCRPAGAASRRRGCCCCGMGCWMQLRLNGPLHGPLEPPLLLPLARCCAGLAAWATGPSSCTMTIDVPCPPPCRPRQREQAEWARRRQEVYF